jgi:hypothetical protein
MITRKCLICGAEFTCYPSDKRVTCGRPECVRENRRKSHKGVSNHWGEAARRKKSAQGLTDNLRAGTPAARKSPIAGRFETNREAKFWRVRSPEGKIYEFTNLRLWARDNCELFGKPKSELSAQQIAHGFYSVYMAQRGVGLHHTITYKGWMLLTVGTNWRNEKAHKK